ncbi:MAG TPA: tRNA 2-thiouridine(34) synthase MnmA [bacterium]|jgi:tRNA-specific 2-thiouridylase
MPNPVPSWQERCGWLPPAGATVLVALSGGVDSAVTAALLHQAGYRVVAATMKTWDEYRDRGEVDPRRAERGCCSMAAVDDCLRITEHLGIPYHLYDFQEEFRTAVIDRFVRDYAAGRTPSPCVPCNGVLKFGHLLEEADRLGCAYIATGHYARRTEVDGAAALLRGVDAERDQAYFLATLPRPALARAVFPLGGLWKRETRTLAAAFGLPVAAKAESREICFVDDDYRAFLARTGAGGGLPGNLVDLDGHRLGGHAGIRNYTIGQRRGLGIATGLPRYVIELRAAANEVVVGGEADLYRREVAVGDLNWLAEPPRDGRVTAQIRSTHRAAPANLTVAPGGDLCLRFAEPVRAPAPGQAVALFTGDRLLGGGTLERVID